MDFAGVWNLITWLVIIAALVYVINGVDRLDPSIKRIITTIGVVVALLMAIRWLLGLRH